VTIRERHRNAYPIGHGRLWGEAAWTATDLVHRPGTLMATVRAVAIMSAQHRLAALGASLHATASVRAQHRRRQGAI